MHILIVEDDEVARDYLAKALREVGHTVDVAGNGLEGLHLASSIAVDLAIVDRMLPKLDGLALVQSLRATGRKMPVLILSALGDVDDRITGLRAGGDDYLTKPYHMSELLARIDALARRGENGSAEANTKLKLADLELDRMTRRVVRNGKKIELTAREFQLLEFMMRHSGQVVTRTMLLEGVWDYHFDPQTNVIDVHISRLRQAIDKLPSGPINVTDWKNMTPPKSRVMTKMEELIHHFIVVTEGLDAPPGEVYFAAENPKGELGFYINSKGGGVPHRLKIRAPSFVNLSILPELLPGCMVSDIVAVLGSLDFVMGECDR